MPVEQCDLRRVVGMCRHIMNEAMPMDAAETSSCIVITQQRYNSSCTAVASLLHDPLVAQIIRRLQIPVLIVHSQPS